MNLLIIFLFLALIVLGVYQWNRRRKLQAEIFRITRDMYMGLDRRIQDRNPKFFVRLSGDEIIISATGRNPIIYKITIGVFSGDPVSYILQPVDGEGRIVRCTIRPGNGQCDKIYDEIEELFSSSPSSLRIVR